MKKYTNILFNTPIKFPLQCAGPHALYSTSIDVRATCTCCEIIEQTIERKKKKIELKGRSPDRSTSFLSH